MGFIRVAAISNCLVQNVSWVLFSFYSFFDKKMGNEKPDREGISPIINARLPITNECNWYARQLKIIKEI